MPLICAQARELGYGIELWSRLHGEEDVFGEVSRRGLADSLQGMNVSIHSAGLRTFNSHRSQIDVASQLGAKVIVFHPKELAAADETVPHLPLIRDLVAYAAERGVRLALENLHEEWHLAFLAEAARGVDGLGMCLDLGHVYTTRPPLAEYLAALGERIIHLHVHDLLAPDDLGLAGTVSQHYEQHYLPGTGTIPAADWELLVATLKRVDFQGTAVFEIRPRDPLQTALLGRRFLQRILDAQ